MTCRATDDGYRVAEEHYDGCEGGCSGCLPCVPADSLGRPLDHCTARKRCTEHVEPGTLTCNRCLGKARRRLTRIVELATLLPVAAVESGSIDSEAANLAGPAADPAGWSDTLLAARAAAAERHGYGTEEWEAAITALPDDDQAHPYAVLSRWQLMLEDDPRECYPVDRDRITVAGAARYLDANLGQLAQDDEQDFALFAREVAACLGHLEIVLAVAVYHEKGAPCPACVTSGEKKPPRLEMRRGRTELFDRWTCSNDGDHTWSDAEYRLRVGTDYLDHAKALTASQIRQRYRIPEGTVRAWAAKLADDGLPLVRKRGKDHLRLTLYDVADAVAVRDGTRRESRRDSA